MTVTLCNKNIWAIVVLRSAGKSIKFLLGLDWRENENGRLSFSYMRMDLTASRIISGWPFVVFVVNT